MGWDGGGAVNLSQDFIADALAGPPLSKISSAKMDDVLEDLATAIEATLNRNGENAIAANINWGGFRITNLGAATAATDAPRARQVAENALQYGGTTGGAANAYTVTQGFLTTLVAGTRLLCLANHTNSGASTLTVNGGSAYTIHQKDGSSNIPANAIVSGYYFEVVFTGASFVLMAGAESAGTGLTSGDIGVTVQAYDADLGTWAAITRAAGFDTFVATPNSVNLKALLTDETGSGAAVFANTPTLVTPVLGEATGTSLSLSSGTGLTVGSSIPFSDAAGVLTLQNVDALDATTEATLEAAIDTLANLTSIQGVSFTFGAYAATLLNNANEAAFKAAVNLEIGVDVQAYDADLTTWAGITPGAGVATFLATPTTANFLAAVTGETGTGAVVFGTSPTITTPAITYSTTPTLTAGTNAQAQGAITTDNVTITTTAANPSGVTLPSATVGRFVTVKNAGTNPVNIYPASADQIDGLAVDTPVSLPVGGTMYFRASSVLQWWSSAAMVFTTPVLGTPASGNLANCTFGQSVPFSDSAGTLTLQNVDVLDATTEATIEAAIDTLANLTSIQGVTFTFGAYAATLLNNANEAAFKAAVNLEAGVDYQAYDADLAAIAGLTSAADRVPYFTGSAAAALATFTAAGRSMVAAASAAAQTALLSAFVGDSGAGGTKGLVPAPAIGDATRYLKGDGTWGTIAGGGDALVANPLSQFAATTSLQLKGVMSDETGSGALVFATSPTLVTPDIGVATATSVNGTAIPASATLLKTSDIGSSVAAAAVGQGQHTIWMPAGAMVAQTTNGAAAGSLETTTNDIMVKYFAFDAATAEGVQFGVQMPKSWDEGTVVAQVVWMHPATATNFGVVWDIGGVAFADDDALDTAIGTVQTATDTGGTTNDVYITPETSAITIAGSPAAEEYVVFRVRRDPANGSDTMAVDAYLLGVKLHYTTNDDTDD